VDSAENKNNIANFFASAKGPKAKDEKVTDREAKSPVKKEDSDAKHAPKEDRATVNHSGTEDNAPLPVPKEELTQGIKREHVDDVPLDEPPMKAPKLSESPAKKQVTPTRKKKSATSNGTSPAKPSGKEKGSQKITSFFGK